MSGSAELGAAGGARLVSRELNDGEHPALSWRVPLSDGGGFLGLRLAAAPLHRRPHRALSVGGSVHPPLARAAALLAAPERGDLVFDPFCGVGTMLLEARSQQMGVQLMGGDVDMRTLKLARDNAAAADGVDSRHDAMKGPPAWWTVADAGRMALMGGCVDVVLTNPPWQRQASLGGSLAAGLKPLWDELAGVTAPASMIVVLLQELGGQVAGIRAAGLRPLVWQPVAVSGIWTVLALLVRPAEADRELERLATRGLRPPPEALFDPGAELPAPQAGAELPAP